MSFDRKSGNDDGFIRLSISSLALAVGDLVTFDRSLGIVIKATSSSSVEDLAGVVVEATTTADTTVLCQKISNEDTEFVASTTNNSNSAHNYQRMVLTDQATVNNTGTDSTNDAAVVMQLYPVGVAADKKIRCRLVRIQDRA